jgi:hypothetical protein
MVDKEKYIGDFHYFKNQDSGFWSPHLASVSIDDNNHNFQINGKGLLDSGTTCLILPENVYNAYVEKHQSILKKLDGNSDQFYIGNNNYYALDL